MSGARSVGGCVVAMGRRSHRPLGSWWRQPPPTLDAACIRSKAARTGTSPTRVGDAHGPSSSTAAGGVAVGRIVGRGQQPALDEQRPGQRRRRVPRPLEQGDGGRGVPSGAGGVAQHVAQDGQRQVDAAEERAGGDVGAPGERGAGGRTGLAHARGVPQAGAHVGGRRRGLEPQPVGRRVGNRAVRDPTSARASIELPVLDEHPRRRPRVAAGLEPARRAAWTPRRPGRGASPRSCGDRQLEGAEDVVGLPGPRAAIQPVGLASQRQGVVVAAPGEIPGHLGPRHLAERPGSRDRSALVRASARWCSNARPSACEKREIAAMTWATAARPTSTAPRDCHGDDLGGHLVLLGAPACPATALGSAG